MYSSIKIPKYNLKRRVPKARGLFSLNDNFFYSDTEYFSSALLLVRKLFSNNFFGSKGG